jgi:GntR family transcriptional regulator
VLSDGIATGRYQPGDLLPGEETLARMFQVSRVTVRRALADLQEAGLIDRKHGLGTIVKAKPNLGESSPMNRLVGQIAKAGKLDVEVLEFEYRVPPRAVQSLLKMQAGQEAQRAVRVRSREKRPVMHLTTYVPADIGRTYTRKDLEKYPLYKLLARAGKIYQRAEQTAGACLADPLVASVLKVKVGVPLLLVQRILLTADNEPVEYLEIRGSSDIYALRMAWQADRDQKMEDGTFLQYETTL